MSDHPSTNRLRSTIATPAELDAKLVALQDEGRRIANVLPTAMAVEVCPDQTAASVVTDMVILYREGEL